MAQQFINCTILEPFSPTNPPGFVEGQIDSDMIFVGAARGESENVYKVVGGGTAHSLQLPDTYASGELLIKYRSVEYSWQATGTASTDVKVFGVSIGGANGFQVFDQFAANKVVIQGLGTNSATRVEQPLQTVAGVRSRFMRLNWSFNRWRVKIWQIRQTEPINWNAQSADPPNNPALAPGPVVLSWSESYFYAFDLHWLAIADSDLETAVGTLPGGNKTITLMVMDTNNRPVSGATVYLYHQATGARLGQTTSDSSGAASFDNVFTADLCYALVNRPTTVTVANFLNKA